MGESAVKTEKTMSKPQVKLVNLGLKSYLPTWKIQQKLVEKVKNDRKSENFLVLVEHNPVFTTGIRTNVYDSNEEKKLKHLGADFNIEGFRSSHTGVWVNKNN